MWRIYYLMHLMKDKKGIGVVEVILILVVKVLMYTECIESKKT